MSDHDRPQRADMLAALSLTRAILAGADHTAAHDAAESGTCPVCTCAAGVSFMISVAGTLLGDQVQVSGRTRAVILSAVDAAENDLRGAGN